MRRPLLAVWSDERDAEPQHDASQPPHAPQTLPAWLLLLLWPDPPPKTPGSRQVPQKGAFLAASARVVALPPPAHTCQGQPLPHGKPCKVISERCCCQPTPWRPGSLLPLLSVCTRLGTMAVRAVWGAACYPDPGARWTGLCSPVLTPLLTRGNPQRLGCAGTHVQWAFSAHRDRIKHGQLISALAAVAGAARKPAVAASGASLAAAAGALAPELPDTWQGSLCSSCLTLSRPPRSILAELFGEAEAAGAAAGEGIGRHAADRAQISCIQAGSRHP